MIEEYGITLVQMMENAGRNLAEAAGRLLGGPLTGRKIVVLCGAGNNGGGGMVAARHLHNRGAAVQVVGAGRLSQAAGAPAPRLKDVPARQWRILQGLGLTVAGGVDLAQADLIIDALIGYGLSGDPLGAVAEWIERANAAARPILALDTPSGLDTTTGVAGRPCIRATATLTLALPKTGLLTPQARPFVGELWLADISVPPQLYRRLGFEVGPVFVDDTVVRINHPG